MSDRRRVMGESENWKKPSELQYGEHVIAVKKEMPPNQSSYPYYYFVADDIQTDWTANIRFFESVSGSESFDLHVYSRDKSGDLLWVSEFSIDTGYQSFNLWSGFVQDAWVTDGDYGYLYFDSLQSAFDKKYSGAFIPNPWYVNTNTVTGTYNQDPYTNVPSITDNLHIWFLTE